MLTKGTRRRLSTWNLLLSLQKTLQASGWCWWGRARQREWCSCGELCGWKLFESCSLEFKQARRNWGTICFFSNGPLTVNASGHGKSAGAALICPMCSFYARCFASVLKCIRRYFSRLNPATLNTNILQPHVVDKGGLGFWVPSTS